MGYLGDDQKALVTFILKRLREKVDVERLVTS
ncbi:hypothetical protein BJY26_000407 [Spelaeicoccus albus]|uniref:Uncharacterized protein n=1 Tax=Spelaeicoccus albus TaxID=1280376 RepID=A0A7Z0CZ92_9MICO|nr:hypothetical protein [Spelaeicoccus albus]